MNNKIYELDDTSKVKHIFDGWNETLIFSCVQKVMGKIYVTDLDNPISAFAYVGCFGFYAGEPEKELVFNKPDGFVIMIPQNEVWGKLIDMDSVHLAEKLGYEYDHEYVAYEVAGDLRTH